MADKLDGAAIVANSLPATAIVAGSITTTQLAPSVANVVTVGSNPKIASLDYPGDDTAANTGGGQTVVINGSGFKSNVSVYINGNAVPSVTYTNANSISITTPALAAATYPLYVINTDDGGTAILIPGIQYSGTPSWVTTSPLSDVMGYGGEFNITGTSWSSVSYNQTGVESGHSSLLMVSGSVGRANTLYQSAQTPISVMSAGMFIKFVSPYLSYAAANNCILRLCSFAGVDTIDIFKSSGSGAIDIIYRTGGVARSLTQTGVDYGWHSYYWTLNRPQDRFRAYFDGTLIGELTGLTAWSVNSWSAFLGGSSSGPTAGTLSAYVQYHTLWASKELTQTEITSIATP